MINLAQPPNPKQSPTSITLTQHPTQPTVETHPTQWYKHNCAQHNYQLPILPPLHDTDSSNDEERPTAPKPQPTITTITQQTNARHHNAIPILPPRIPIPTRPTTTPPTWHTTDYSSDTYYEPTNNGIDESLEPNPTENNSYKHAATNITAFGTKHNNNKHTNHQPTSTLTNQQKRNKFDDKLTIITQNIRGLPLDDDTKLQSLVYQMKCKQWAAVCAQETWRLGSDDFYIDGHRILLQGNTTKSNDQGQIREGVCIILNPTLDAAYKLSGSKKITLPNNHEHEGRFIGVHLHFKKRDNYGKPIRGTTKITLCSLYHPVDPRQHIEFGNTIHTLLGNTPNDTALLFGHDINCNVLGTNNTLPDSMRSIIGPFGLENRNPKGVNFLQQLGTLEMRVANSYFIKPNYVTWKGMNPNKPSYHMLDVFSISASLFKHVTDCGASKHGIDDSDHSATSITLNIGSIKKKTQSTNHTRNARPDWKRILQDPETNAEFNYKLSTEYESITTQCDDYTTFNETILESGTTTAISDNKPTLDWFEMSKDKIQPLIDRITTLRAKQRSQTDPDPHRTTTELKLCIRLKSIAIRDAKSKYMSYIAEQIGTLSGDNTKEMWDAIRKCKLGHEVNYQRPKTMALTLPNGQKATTDKQNMSVLQPHCEKLFNNAKPVAPNALEHIHQRETEHSLDDPITWKEFTKALNGLKNNKSPGANEIPAEAFKAMNNENRSLVFNFINNFWNGERDFDEWHTGRGVPVPKTNHPSNPNQYRIVNLMDVGSKIFSRILTARLYLLLEKHGTKHQFGATPRSGCQDGNFTLKTFLHLRRQHNLETYVVFADLVKAFDTSNHVLISQILERYGTPTKLSNAIKRLYSDLRVTIKLGKESVDIQQTVGVRQGDNLSPVIFLFVMTAFAETLEHKWTLAGLPRIEAQYKPITPTSTAQLTGHIRPARTNGTTTTLTQVMFLDDSSFPFNNRNDAAAGTRIIKETFADLGLEMHCGTDTNPKSKTEILWIPAPPFYSTATNEQLTPPITMPPTNYDNTHLTQLAYLNESPQHSPSHTTNIATTATKTPRKVTFHTMSQAQREKLYWSSPNTRRLTVDSEGSFIDFTAHFKYLGSYISFDLTDDIDIANRITKANQAMAALRHFWRNPYADLRAKKLIFLAIPANLLLWGCETWALRQNHIDQLNVFWHRAIRTILGIRMQEVIDDHISNERIRKIFHDIPDAFATLTARSMTYLGKTVRAPDFHPPKQLVTAWIQNPRPKSGVLMTNKKALVRGINILLPDETTETVESTNKQTGETTFTNRPNPDGKLKNWIHIALDKPLWEWHIHKLSHPNQPIPPKPTPNRRNPQDNNSNNNSNNDDSNGSNSNNRSNNNNNNNNNNNENNYHAPPPRSNSTNNRRHHHRQQQENTADQQHPSRNHERQNYNINNVGHNIIDSLKALGLVSGATTSEIKHRFRQLSLIYHPDKYSPHTLHISKEEATAHFQLINNAYDFLRNN